MKIQIPLLLVALFQQISCYSQETTFLNRFHYPVKDTVAHKPSFYQVINPYSDSTIVKLYNLEKILLKEEVYFLEKGKEIYRKILEYDSIGNIVHHTKIDRKTNSENSVSYYPNGQLKSRHHYVNHEAVLEEYFDENGKPVKKPDEVLPSPNGGMKGWNKYLAKNLTYPKEARKKRQEGIVYIWFRVDSDGSLRDPEIMNPEQVSPLLAKEALRMIEEYPDRWSPGIKDGIPISVNMRMPINFKL